MAGSDVEMHHDHDGPEPDAGWPHAAASRFVVCEGVRWHVQQLGQGPVILLIHGTGASSHSWDELIDTLASDFTLVAADLPGHGLSGSLPGREMSLESLAGRLGRLLTGLAIIPDVIVGHSAGAAIALRMVLDGAVPSPKLIVAVNGALQPFGGIAGVVFPPLARLMASGTIAARILASRAGQPGAVARMLEGTGSKPPARSLACYERLLKQPSHVKATLDMMAHWNLEELRSDLPRLWVPLELIACGADSAVPAESAFAVKDAVPGSHVTFIRNLGHLAHEDQPGLIAAKIREAWCERAAPRASDTRHDPGGRLAHD